MSTLFVFANGRRERSETASCSNLERKLLTACNESPSISEESIVELRKVGKEM